MIIWLLAWTMLTVVAESNAREARSLENTILIVVVSALGNKRMDDYGRECDAKGWWIAETSKTGR